MSPSRACSRLAAALTLLAGACSSNLAGGGPPRFFPQEPDPPLLQHLRSIAVDTDIVDERSGLDTMLFGEQVATRALRLPNGITFRDGIFYVADMQVGGIVALDLTERTMELVRLQGRTLPARPAAVGFAEDGRLLVGDLVRRQVLVYDDQLRLVRELGPWSEESRPNSLVVRDGKLHVADTGDKVVRVFDLQTYEELLAFGNEGDVAGRLLAPTSVALDAEGNYYVSDAIRNRVFVYGPDGAFLRHVGEVGMVPGTFARPKGLTFHDDLLFVLDAAFENCQVFNPQDQVVLYFAGPGDAPGTLNLPAGIWIGEEAVDLFRDRMAPGFQAEAIVAITNLNGSNRVTFFAWGRMEGEDYSAFDLYAGGNAPAAPQPDSPTDG